MTTTSNRVRLTVLFLTVLVDLIGFGIVLPLLPLYAERFGGSGTEIGILVLAYSGVQFFMAPFWGGMSDRFGRRPILILGLVGSAFAYLVFAYADSLLLLLLSRMLGGVGGSTIPVAEAYISDITPPERRAGNIGLIGAAFGLGFTIGPALGGTLAGSTPALPGLVAAGLCAANALVALMLLPESSKARTRGAPARPWTGLPALRQCLKDRRVAVILAVYFLFSTAWAVLQPTFSLFGAMRFGFDERQVGYLFAFLGLTSAVMQGGLVRRLVPWLGEPLLVRFSGVPFVLGMVLTGLSQSLPALLAGLALLAIGYGGVVPAALGLLSRSVPADVQGSTLGISQSVGSLARMVGPLTAGMAFDALGIQWPYLMAAAVAAGATMLALGLTKPAAEPSLAEIGR